MSSSSVEKDLVIHNIYYYDGESHIYKLPERLKTAKDMMEWLEDVTYYTSGAYIDSIEIEYGNPVLKCIYEGEEEKYPFKLNLEVMKRKRDNNNLYVALRLEQYEHALLAEILWMKFLPDFIVKGELLEVTIPLEEYRPSYD
jgi:hypothetical protein